MKKLLCITTAAVLLPIAAVSAAELQATSPKSVIPAAAVMPAASAAPRLPSIAGLTKNSDYSAFVQPGVPLEIHQAALRKLWSTQADVPPAVSGDGAF